MASDAPQFIESFSKIVKSHHFVRISGEVRQMCKVFFQDHTS